MNAAVIIGITLQTLGVFSAILFFYLKQHQERARDRVEHAERLTRMETKVDLLYRFWERYMERRSVRDEQAWEAKHTPLLVGLAAASAPSDSPNGSNGATP